MARLPHARGRKALSKNDVPAFAIVRLEREAASADPQLQWTVVGVFVQLEEAQMKIADLERLNGDKGVQYFLQKTRLKGMVRNA